MNIKSLVWICLASLRLTVNGLRNPILHGWNPDPSIVRVGADYFLATSSFEYFPGHPIYHSTDLVKWDLIGHALNRPSQLDLLGTPPDAGIWAPTLRYHDGVFYIATTARHAYGGDVVIFSRSFVVNTTDIFSNEWSDPIFLDNMGYDPDLFWDVNGDVYTTWAGINNAVDNVHGIWQNRIDLETGTSLTEAVLIFNGTLGPLDDTVRPEGPHIYHINSTYYLAIAEGWTGHGHRTTIQRSTVSPSGPWEDNPANPILYNGADPSLSIQATGHSDFVQGVDGEWWGTALGVRPQSDNLSISREQLGRETFLYPVTWEDGWPIVNHGQPLTEHIPDVLIDVAPDTSYFNDFSQPELDHSFYYLRTPQKTFHYLTANPRSLRLYGTAYSLGDRDSPSLLLRKQSNYTETFETQLDFNPTSNLTRAGITVFYSDYLHNEIGITGDADARYIFTRTTAPATQVGPWALTAVNSTVVTTTYVPLSSKIGAVTLVIQALPASYSLGFSEQPADNATIFDHLAVPPVTYPTSNATDATFVTTFDSSAMTVPPAHAAFFKGAAFGIFNSGTGRPSLVPADFAYWKQVS